MIEKVFGINATSITLNARFTILTESPPLRIMRQRKRLVSHTSSNNSYNLRSQKMLAQQIAYRLKQRRRQTVKLRLGLPRYRSESSLPGLKRANSTGNVSQSGSKTRLAWNHVNRNLRWEPPFINNFGVRHASGLPSRTRLVRGGVRGRGGRRQMGRLQANGLTQQGRARGARGGRGRGLSQGKARGRGKGATTPNKVPTKEELDSQLDQYMANSQWALDRQLDDYMKDAMNEE